MPGPTPDPNALPIPLGVRSDTASPQPALTLDSLQHLFPDIPLAAFRAQNTTVLGPDATVSDPNDLTQTGWCVLFASDADPTIQQQLQPLIDLRRSQVVSSDLFKVFAGDDPNTGGVLLNPDKSPQSASEWARLHGVSLNAPVDPSIIPYYILIVGSPARIPFEFQAALKLQWLVGRLHFDDIADYGRYAAHVVAHESKPWPTDGTTISKKNAAVWVTRNQGDVATLLLWRAITGDFRDGKRALGAGPFGFTVDVYADDAATKSQLADLMRGRSSHGQPSVLFTGSHGLECPITEPAHQLTRQGSLITQAWSKGTAFVEKDDPCKFTAADIPADNTLPGTMVFLFACYSAGCPAADNYYFNTDGSQIPVAPEPLIAALPQALLANGSLAVIGHIDRAFPYAFVNLSGTPQIQTIRTPLELMMRGTRVGLAADSFSLAWSSMASLMQLPASATPNAQAVLASLQAHIARDDARNYIVLGDPATRLRVKPD